METASAPFCLTFPSAVRMALGKPLGPVTLDLSELRWPALTTAACIAVYSWQVQIRRPRCIALPPALSASDRQRG